MSKNFRQVDSRSLADIQRANDAAWDAEKNKGAKDEADANPIHSMLIHAGFKHKGEVKTESGTHQEYHHPTEKGHKVRVQGQNWQQKRKGRIFKVHEGTGAPDLYHEIKD